MQVRKETPEIFSFLTTLCGCVASDGTKAGLSAVWRALDSSPDAIEKIMHFMDVPAQEVVLRCLRFIEASVYHIEDLGQRIQARNKYYYDGDCV